MKVLFQNGFFHWETFLKIFFIFGTLETWLTIHSNLSLCEHQIHSNIVVWFFWMIRREYFPPKFQFVLGCHLPHGAEVTEGNGWADTKSFLLYSATCSSCRIGECREREDKLKEWSCASGYVLLGRAQHRSVGILGVFLSKLRLKNSAETSYFQFSLREACKPSQLHTNTLKTWS